MKDKNIRPLAGHPLLAYSIRAAKLAGIEEVYVSTDSLEYELIAKKYGAEVILRPAELAADTSTDYEFIAHALDLMRPTPTLLVHLRPTTPLRDPAEVARAVALLARSPDATSLRSVHPMSESAYKALELEDGGPYLKSVGSESSWIDDANDPRQSFPVTFCPNGYVDVLKTAFVQGNKCLHGNQSIGYITTPVTEVDTEEDFARLEFEAARDPQLVRRLFDE